MNMIKRVGANFVLEYSAKNSLGQGIISGLTVTASIRKDVLYWDDTPDTFSSAGEVQLTLAHVINGLYRFTSSGGAVSSSQSYEIHLTVTGNPDVNENSTFTETIESGLAAYPESVYLGDFANNTVLNTKFKMVNADGFQTSLLGTPNIAVYRADSVTQITVAITLTVDFDGRTGFNNVKVDLNNAAYFGGQDYQIVILQGTIDGVSVEGHVIASFSIENRFMRGTDSAFLASSAPANFSNLGIESNGNVTKVDLVTTTTTNTDMRGTDSAATAADLAVTDSKVTDIKSKTDNQPEGIKRNTVGGDFHLGMVLSSDDKTPATGKTVTCQRSIDTGAFVNMTAITATEIGSGEYRVALSAADTNGEWITYKFTAPDCNTKKIKFKTVL